MVFGLLALPVLAAIWWVPWFVTQDGPSHLHNAQIMAALLKPSSPLKEWYTLHWFPLPNLAGHLSLMGLMAVLSARTADRVMMSVTFVGLSGSILWLRWQVAGPKRITLLIPLAVIIALNWMWLLGFYSFLLGACLFPMTLGIWWAGREQMGPQRALVLAGLLVVGYLCHLVSLALTIVSLMVLASITPGPNRGRRWLWTLISFTPLIPLGVVYYQLMHANGAVQPDWRHLNPWSPRSWLKYVMSADFLTLSHRKTFPFVEQTSSWFGLLSPRTLVAVALAVLVAGTIFARMRKDGSAFPTRHAWTVLTLLLLIGWLVGPTNFGVAHGDYLRERILLFGLMTLVPVLELDSTRVASRVSAAVLIVAVVIQSAFVWEYALCSDAIVADFLQAKPYVGTGRRAAILQLGPIEGLPAAARRMRVHSYPSLGGVLAIDTGNLVWNNYEAHYYYFPVKFRQNFTPCYNNRGPTQDYDFLFIDPHESTLERARRWSCRINQSHQEIDVLVVRGADVALDTITHQWYGPEPVFERGNVRVFQHR